MLLFLLGEEGERSDSPPVVVSNLEVLLVPHVEPLDEEPLVLVRPNDQGHLVVLPYRNDYSVSAAIQIVSMSVIS
jgi:hypothetical protein